MSMCGHATIGTVWLLHTLGKLRSRYLSIETLSGNVSVRIHGAEGEQPFIEISQPDGDVTPLNKPELRDEIIQTIGLEPEDILDLPFLNSTTSRVKTLIPVKSPERLDAARPDSDRIEQLCEQLHSTGFYLFCAHPGKDRQFDSQFPKASGYP